MNPVITSHQIKFNDMKKIFTLTVGILMTAVMFAADRRPTVTINSSRNFQIVIDGRIYSGANDGRMYSGGSNEIRLPEAFGGRHTIKVFEQSRGFFGRSSRMVDVATFKLINNDVIINVDRFGMISIREVKAWNKYDRNNRGYGQDDRGYDQDNRDQNDRNFDPRNGQNDRQHF
jgi:hypothetical protein